METRLVEYFVAVAEELSFTKAAARVYSSQSTVSAGIRALERELGSSLFTRSTKSVELSSAGHALLPEARSVLDGLERMRGAVTGSGAELRGRVRVGIFTNLPGIDIPALVGGFRARHPLVDLQLTASSTGSTGFADDVRAGRLDLALMGLPRSDLGGLAVHDLLLTRFVAVVPVGHPFAEKASVRLSDLVGERFVDTPAGFGNRVVLDRALAAAGLRREVSTEAPDLGEIPRFVAAGLGVAVIPRLGAEVPGAVAVSLADPLDWPLSAVTRPRTTAPVEALLGRLRATFPSAAPS